MLGLRRSGALRLLDSAKSVNSLYGDLFECHSIFEKMKRRSFDQLLMDRKLASFTTAASSRLKPQPSEISDSKNRRLRYYNSLVVHIPDYLRYEKFVDSMSRKN